MKNTFLTLLILVFSTTFSQNQRILATPISSGTQLLADRFLGLDSFGDCYFIKDNSLYKKKDAVILEYKNLSFGEITAVDFINPLQIIVYYEPFNTLISLDNQLNEIQKISFTDQTITATGLASQNRFWLYDQNTQQIGLYNSTKKTYAVVSRPINGILQHFETNLNYFHWIDSNQNWYSCSVFGEISSLKKVPNFDKIQIIDADTILFSKGEHLYLLDFKKNLRYEIENVKKSFDSFFYKDQILSIFNNRQLMNYKITIP